MTDQAGLFQRGHLVSDSGSGELAFVLTGDQVTGDRLRERDVLLDDVAQDLFAAGRQLGHCVLVASSGLALGEGEC